MPYKKSYRNLLATTLVLLASISMSLGHAQAELSREILNQSGALETLEKQKRSIDVEAQKIRQALLAKSKEIQALKEKQAQSHSPLLSYRLQTLLQDAQIMASELSGKESEKHQLQSTRATQQQILLQILDQNIEVTTQKLKDRNNSATEKAAYTHQLQELVLLRTRWSDPPEALDLPTTPNMAVAKWTDQDDVRAQAALLDDTRDHILRKLRENNQQMAALKRQFVLMDEVRHLLNEEAFFAETSFAKHLANNGTQGFNAIPKITDIPTNGIDNNTGTNLLPSSNIDLNGLALSTPIRRIQLDTAQHDKSNNPLSSKSRLQDLQIYRKKLNELLAKVESDIELVRSMLVALEPEHR